MAFMRAILYMPGMFLILVVYALVGAYLIHRLPPNDVERSMLDIDHHEMARRYAHEFGGTIPERMPFRLPLEYWLWGWTDDLPSARLVGAYIGGLGFTLTTLYARHLGGTRAALIAGCIVVTSPILMRGLVSASYVPYVATLWVGGLYALATGHPFMALACAVGLTLIRPTSWWMAGTLLIHVPWHWSLPVAFLLACYLWGRQREVVLSQGWVRLLRREPCPVQGIPQDGWGYAVRIAATRFEAWGALGLVALVVGRWESAAVNLLLISAGVAVMTHLPRALIRPKWVLGYAPEFALPVAVALGILLQ